MTKIERKALNRLGPARILLAAVPGGIKTLAEAFDVSPSRVSQVLRENPLPTEWAEVAAELIGCGPAEVYRQLDHKPLVSRFGSPPDIVWIDRREEDSEMTSLKEDPIDRANRRRLESDKKWISASSRKAADQLLAGAREEANRLVGCEADLEHDDRTLGVSLDRLVLRYAGAAVYVDCYRAPDPTAPAWPFPVVGIWKEGGRFRHASPRCTETVYFRVVPAVGDGSRWHWRVVGSGPNEGIEEDLDGMVITIFELLTSDSTKGD
ncbi:hypothetical protein [Candidatus Palauibacter sp.]|uniref:hypothetical protein n=1 Tax=Candidatus Palauibacter sp. TaxID=3101350 RepID=UPI003B02DDD1